MISPDARRARALAVLIAVASLTAGCLGLGRPAQTPGAHLYHYDASFWFSGDPLVDAEVLLPLPTVNGTVRILDAGEWTELPRSGWRWEIADTERGPMLRLTNPYATQGFHLQVREVSGRPVHAHDPLGRGEPLLEPRAPPAPGATLGDEVLFALAPVRVTASNLAPDGLAERDAHLQVVVSGLNRGPMPVEVPIGWTDPYWSEYSALLTARALTPGWTEAPVLLRTAADPR